MVPADRRWQKDRRGQEEPAEAGNPTIVHTEKGKTMADLTSKSELIRDLEKECDSIIITPFTASYELRALKSALRMAIKRIEKSPAVDAVPVVRCKECTYKRITKGSMEVKSYSCNCTWSPCRGRIVEPSFFCFYGEEEQKHETDRC